MKLDRKALERLSGMSDAQLRAVVEKLVRDYHLDLSALNLSTNDMESLRRALRTATDEELLTLAKKLGQRGK